MAKQHLRHCGTLAVVQRSISLGIPDVAVRTLLQQPLRERHVAITRRGVETGVTVLVLSVDPLVRRADQLLNGALRRAQRVS